MGEIGAALEAGVNIVDNAAKTAKGVTSAGESATNAAGEIGVAVGGAGEVAGSLLNTPEIIQSTPEVTESIASTGIAAVETTGGIENVAEAFPETVQSSLEAGEQGISAGEQAAEKASELVRADTRFTKELRTGDMTLEEVRRTSQVREELNELRLQQMKESSKLDGQEEKEDDDEEWEAVKKGDKIVIRKRKPGVGRAVGDFVSDLTAEVARDAGKKS